MPLHIQFLSYQHETESRWYGPYPFVQMTYESLRVGPDGDHLSFFNGDWQDPDDPTRKWSDVVIHAVGDYPDGAS